MADTSNSAAAMPAATVVVARDGASGLEVLLVQRSEAVSHMGGMWVFPGGKVDPQDAQPAASPLETARAAAIRETREEVGLEVSDEQLLYLSHWTTPQGAKRSYSTWFFLCVLDDGQEVEVDGGEIARHRWCSPAQAFADIEDDEHPFFLAPPTYVSIVQVSEFADCSAARSHLANAEPDVFEPEVVIVDGGYCFLYHGDVAYGSGDLDRAGARHRTYMVNKKLDYQRYA